MKRLFAIASVMLLFCAMFIAVVCVAGDSSAVVARPFKATWSGGSNFLGPFCQDGSLLVLTTAKGIATITGASEFNATYCCYPTGVCTGAGVIAAANGDMLYLTLIHRFDPVSLDWSETEVITGGTGRFEGATGTSSGSGTSMMTGPTMDFWAGTSEGEISF